MADTALLTVAIPTFNRSAHVVPEVAALRAASLPAGIEVLVVDDASDDGTFDALAADVSGSGFRILRNETNLGYARNVLRLFEACETPYLLISSDDDHVETATLGPLLALLASETPSFVSSQLLDGGELRRGRGVVGPIEPRDVFAASSHAPGLVYKVADAASALAELTELLEQGDDAAWVYPQVVVASSLLGHGRGMWFDHACVTSGARLPSGIRDSTDERWDSLPSRWRQAQGFLSLYRRRLDTEPDPAVRSRFAAMLAEEEARLFGFLRFGLAAERPELLEVFDDGARRFTERRRPTFWARRFLRAPRATIVELRRRLDEARR